MKIISCKPAGGVSALGYDKRRVVLELDPGEELLAVREDAHYRLGQPLEDVIASHVLKNAVQVMWCSVEQRWTE